MESEVLQEIGGTRGVEVCPYIRTIDMVSSNSYVLSARDQIGLLDPGGDDDQMDRLVEVIGELYHERPRPVLIYLTHVHVDHSFELSRGDLLAEFGGAAVAVQEAGALSLERGDPAMTLSCLLGRKVAPSSPEVRLLSSADLAAPGRRLIELARGAAFEYETASFGIGGGIVLHRQRVELGGGDALDIYHTPGHSPDSVCLRAGEVLFLGDLLFASNPGVAGIPGWSRDDQMESIRRALWILDEGNVQVCCPGHGRPMDAGAARKTLLRLLQYTESLGDLLLIDGVWAREAAEYSAVALREMERLFTIIAGRLILVSSVLEDLEEGAAAREVEGLVDSGAVDDLFSRWHDRLSSPPVGGVLEIEVVHEAGRLVGKLERIFDGGGVRDLFEDHLLRRAERLLNDCMATYRGFRPPQCLRAEDLNSILRGSIDGFLRKPFDEAAILEAETEEEHLRALKARISYVNLPERVAVAFAGSEGLAPAIVDGERLTDLVIDLLERLAAAGAEEVAVGTFQEAEAVSIRIAGRGPGIRDPFRRDELRYLERSISLAGGDLLGPGGGGEPAISIRFSRDREGGP